MVNADVWYFPLGQNKPALVLFGLLFSHVFFIPFKEEDFFSKLWWIYRANEAILKF